MIYPGLFQQRTRTGRDWLRRIPQDDRKAFARIGMEAHNYGRQGGKARAANAKRDQKGRFTK